MPIRGRVSPTLEHALALVARDDLVEHSLLRPRVIQIVIDDLVAERGPCDRALLERLDRLAQRVWKALRVRLVRVPLERRWQLEPFLDPVEPGGDQRGEREVRVDISAGKARLDSLPGTVPDDPEAASAVVVPPRKRGRRPRASGVTLVRVDRRREEDRELACAGDPAREE